MNNYPIKYCQDGITSEVFTVTSQMNIEDLIKEITEIKCNAVSNWINSLDVDIENSLVIGADLTGIGLAKRLKKISKVEVVDIYPHMRNLLDEDVEFHSKIDMIKNKDIVVDTTGLGGLTPEITKLINGKTFLVEDPASDGSDDMINNKSNIEDRLKSASVPYKGILKTEGLNSKTSGTMTLTMEVLRNSLKDVLKKPGVLYGVAGMDFYEGILFKEKNVGKFLDHIKKPALTVSTLDPFSCDDIINEYLKKIYSKVEKC